jgi:signal peptidase I
MTHGDIGYVTYGLLGVLSALAVFYVMSAALGTSLPIVAVVSGSMDHGIYSQNGNVVYPCDKSIDGYVETFDMWWQACGFEYASEFGISKEQFMQFPFSDGFDIGDMPVIQSAESYSVGDVIVYNVDGQAFPIIHRVVAINSDGTYQTKGDHNAGQNSYELSVREQQIEGRVIFIIPKLGYVKVGLNRLVGL